MTDSQTLTLTHEIINKPEEVNSENGVDEEHEEDEDGDVEESGQGDHKREEQSTKSLCGLH